MKNYTEIADYIIKYVQEHAILNSIQYCVDYDKVSTKFNIELSEDDIELIVDALYNREEICEVLTDEDTFDVLLFTKFAPNYDPEDDY